MSPESLAPAATASPARTGALQRTFSFPAAVAALLAVLGVLTVRGRFDDPDMWWHLKLGEVTWTSHRIPAADLFSYTTNHHSRIAQEWLSQLLIYAAFKAGGYSGLMVWLCLFTAAILIAGYALCSIYSGNAKVAFLGALTIWVFGTSGFAVRPQMIGYLLLILELLVLQLGRSRSPRWYLAMPPLFALWANCHSSFFLGLVVAALVLFSSYWSFQSGLLVAARWMPRDRRMLAIAVALSLLAVCLNPGGVKLVGYPLDTLFHQPIVLSAVSEWQPLQLTDPRGIALLAALGAIVLLVIARREELFWHEALTIAVATWIAGSHRRLVFPAGILIAPVLSRLLANSWDRYRAQRDHPVANAVLIASSLLTVFLAFPSRRNLIAQVEDHSPVKAVEFIQAQHLPAPMLNDWDDGGYLIWAAPEYPVFIDGRADVYEWTGVIDEFGKWATLQTAPDLLLDKYHINFCLLERNSPMANVLPLLPNWKAAYSDARSVIFVRTPPVSPTR